MSSRARLILIASAVVFIAVTLTVAAAAGLEFGQDDAAAQTGVSAAEARDSAIRAAGVAKDEATVIRRKLYRENGKPLYAVSFYTNPAGESTVYDCVVDAETGKVIASGKTVQNDVTVKKADLRNGKKTAKVSDYIGVSKARSLALYNAGFSEKEVVVDATELVFDGGRPRYRVGFRSDEVTYRFYVDAVSGKVVRRETEFPDD